MHDVDRLIFNRVFKSIPHRYNTATSFNPNLAFEKHQLKIALQYERHRQKPNDQVSLDKLLTTSSRTDADILLDAVREQATKFTRMRLSCNQDNSSDSPALVEQPNWFDYKRNLL